MEEFLVKWVILKELEIIYTKIYQETLIKRFLNQEWNTLGS